MLIRIFWVRVEEMFEEPSTKNGDGTFRQSTLGSPSIVLDHSQLLECSLLSEVVVDEFESGAFNFSSEGVFFS